MTALFRLFGKLPLRLNHMIGALLGYLIWGLSKRHRKLCRQNLALYNTFVSSHNRYLQDYLQSALKPSVMIAEQGKGISELAIAWTLPVEKLAALVKNCEGWKHVVAAKAAKQAIIFVTPHLGCFDIAGHYLGSRIPLLALFRAPKQKWLEPIMQAGRIRGDVTTASANAGGVRALLKTLKSGGNIIILPDQVPGVGDGVWADFFHHPAYTMTLLPRLAVSTNAAVLFFFAERLPKGGGYHLHIEAMAEPFSTDKNIAARQMNALVEALICKAPTQYWWGYNRYKHPAGAPLPPPAREKNP